MICKRFLSSNVIEKIPKIAIVGSGPSAFYTCLNLLEKNNLGNKIQIDMFEKNPSPFGLVRYGVAPDHPEVKNCIDRFNEIGKFNKLENFKFYGNVEIGKDLKLDSLVENYNMILFAYGANKGNNPNISGSNHPGIINSYDFVNWYNDYPNKKNLNLPLNKIENVIVIGNGNVAIDIVRILFSDLNKLKKTDINNEFINNLKESSIKNIKIVGRRGILDSKFTNKEFRELLELDTCCFDNWNKEDFVEQLKDAKLGRVEKRRISLIEKFEKIECNKSDRLWSLQYLLEPIGIKIKDDKLIDEVIFNQRKLIKSPENKWEIKNSGKIVSLKTDLVILATGYSCEPLEEFEECGIPFNSNKKLIENEDGKIQLINNESKNCGFYVVGWLSNGSTGNINSTVMTSNIVANSMIQDLRRLLDNWHEENDNKLGRQGIDKLINKKVIDWDDWNKIHEIEIKNGKEIDADKPYSKMDFKEMVKSV